MTLKQRNMVRVYLGVKDDDVMSDDDIDVFIEQAEDEDESGGDDISIALLACSIIAQTTMWQNITKQVDGLTIDTSDVFIKLLKDRLYRKGQMDMIISDDDYVESI